MTFWNTGDEEHNDERFREAGLAATGLYVMAGSWCFGSVRGQRIPMPDAWVVPDHFVRSWPGGLQAAKRLVNCGLWKKVPGGYEYGWIRPSNSPQRITDMRKSWRESKAGEKDE